ncbi:5012_t:CDS:2, partial [Diversispora eburnea]
MKGNKLLIKYIHKEEEKELNAEQLQSIKDYIQKSGNNTLTREDLEKKGKDNNSTDENNKSKGNKTALYISLGIIGVVLIGLVVILVRKNKKEELKKIIIERKDDKFHAGPNLSKEEVEKINGGILNLTEYPNLEEVVINGEFLEFKLTKLILGNQEKLVSLTVINNKELVSIDVSKCSTLKELNCSGNKLTNLTLGKSLRLTKLDASNNSLSNSDFLSNKGNKKILVELNLQNNEFSEDLYCCGSFPKLKILKISNNKFNG